MKYHDITKDDMKNGDGLRAVLWVSGCNHKCKGCQNPITWDCNDGLIFDDNAENELLDILSKDYISGLTLSGGDPLFPGNREMILRLTKKIKSLFPLKTIWLYTGYKWEEINDLEIMRYVDVIIDGEYIESLRDIKLKWRGSSNQRIILVKESLLNNSISLYD